MTTRLGARRIASHGIISTPVLAIDDQVAGRVPAIAELADLIRSVAR